MKSTQKSERRKKEEKRRKMKKTLKTNKGITLIALVVTIVVLIILATISINAVFGENGLIARTKKAKNMTTIAELEEKANMGIIESLISTHLSEGRVEPLEAALAVIEEEGYNIIEGTTGTTVSGIKFYTTDGLELTKLVIPAGETVRIKVSTETKTGTKKNYIQIEELYYEVEYNETKKTISINKEGIETIGGTANTDVEMKTSSGIITINGGNKETVKSGESVQIATETTESIGTIVGTCGTVTKELPFEIEAKVELKIESTTAEAYEGTTVGITQGESATIKIGGKNYGDLTILTQPDTYLVNVILDDAEDTLTITATDGPSTGSTTIVIKESKKDQTLTITIDIRCLEHVASIYSGDGQGNHDCSFCEETLRCTLTDLNGEYHVCSECLGEWRHEFNRGVCRICFYECPHPIEYVEDWGCSLCNLNKYYMNN